VVIATGADVTFRAGDVIALADGFEVAQSAQLNLETDPALSCDSTVDNDLDTFDGCIDCDDGNDQIFPGAGEFCNGLDDDCDGTPDEQCSCLSGTSNCDDIDSDCEVVHGANPLTCGTAQEVDPLCGDEQCGFLCPQTNFNAQVTRSGKTGMWFRAWARLTSAPTAVRLSRTEYR
jgi:hypothetical protein